MADYTDAQIKSYVESQLASGATWDDITATANQLGVSMDRVNPYKPATTSTPSTTGDLTQQQIDSARTLIDQQYGGYFDPTGQSQSGSLFSNGTYDPYANLSGGNYGLTPDERNWNILGMATQNGYSVGDLAQITGLSPEAISGYVQNYFQNTDPNAGNYTSSATGTSTAAKLDSYGGIYSGNRNSGMFGDEPGQFAPFDLNQVDYSSLGYLSPQAQTLYSHAIQNGYYNPQTDQRVPIVDASGHITGYQSVLNPYATLPDYLQGGYAPTAAQINEWRAAHPGASYQDTIMAMRAGQIGGAVSPTTGTTGGSTGGATGGLPGAGGTSGSTPHLGGSAGPGAGGTGSGTGGAAGGPLGGALGGTGGIPGAGAFGGPDPFAGLTAPVFTQATNSDNPYLGVMADEIGRRTNDALQQAFGGIRQGAQLAGQYGSSRQGIAEGNAIEGAADSLQGQLANLYGQDWTGLQNRNLQQYGMDLSQYNNTRAQNLQRYGIDTQAQLGLNGQNQQFYTQQRQLDQSGAALGASLYGQGNAGYLSQGSGVQNLGNQQQQAAWNPLNAYNNLIGSYTGFGQTSTSGTSGGGGMGTIGGALAGNVIGRNIFGTGGFNTGDMAMINGGGFSNFPAYMLQP